MNWIQGAIKHPGSLRAIAKRKGLIKGDEKLASSDLAILGKSKSGSIRRKIALARTLKKLRK